MVNISSTKHSSFLTNERTNEYCIYWSMLYGTLLVFGKEVGGDLDQKSAGLRWESAKGG